MAPVKGVYGFRVKPGRFEEWRSLAREGEKLVGRFGGRNMRAMMPVAAGPESDICYSTVDYASAEEWGKFQDAIATEVEAQVLAERIFGHIDSPAELLNTGIITEIPLDTETTATGPVLDVWVTRPRPGRYLDAVAFGNEIAPRLVNEGARAVHLYVSGPSGTQSGTHAFVVEHADFASYGRMSDATSKPEWAELMLRALAADAPFDFVQHSLMREVLPH